jgi:hypothetical protein
MMYLWPCSNSLQGFSKQYGVLSSPQKWTVEIGIREGRTWALDNASFNNGFDADKFMAHLNKLAPYRSRCLFITVPDIVGDANATLTLWHKWSPMFDGWPLAFVAQDGQEYLAFPAGCSFVFIGGTDDFKLGAAGRICIERALQEGKRVHIGRVNSQVRYKYFEMLGAHSCDGTGPIYAQDNYKRLLDEVLGQPSFFRAALPDSDHTG